MTTNISLIHRAVSRCLFATLLIVAAVLSTGCSKSEDAPAKLIAAPKGSYFESGILSAAPAGTFGFAYVNLEGTAFDRYVKDQASVSNLSDQMMEMVATSGGQGVSPEEMEKIKSSMKALTDLPTKLHESGLISQVALFINEDKAKGGTAADPASSAGSVTGGNGASAGNPLDNSGMGLVILGTVSAEGAKAPGLRAGFEKLKDSLMKSWTENPGGEFKSERREGFDLYTLEIDGSNRPDNKSPGARSAQQPPMDIFLAVSDKRLVMGFTEPQVEALVTGNNDVGVKALVETPHFRTASSDLVTGDSLLMFGYLDALSAKNLLPPSDQPLPVQGVAISSNYTGDLKSPGSSTFAARVVLDRNQPAVKDGLSQFATKASSTAQARLAAFTDSLVAIRIDSVLLRELGGFAAAAAAAANQSATNPGTAPFPFAQNISEADDLVLALKGPSGATPFPDLVLVAGHSDPAAFVERIKTEVSALLASSGMPVAPMQDREVDGRKITFTMSPLGIGAYLVPTSNSVILATTEGAALNTAKQIDEKGASVPASIGAGAKSLLTTTPIIFAHFDFARAAKTIDQVQGGLMMFTGGQPLVDPQQVKDIAALGQSSFAVALVDGVVKIDTVSRLAANMAK